MKTYKEYILILNDTLDVLDKQFPNWKLISDRTNFARLFAKCLPNDLTYEDIVILSFYFHKLPEKKEDNITIN